MAKGEKIVQGSQAIVSHDEYIKAFKEGFKQGYADGYRQGQLQWQLQGFSQVTVPNHNPNPYQQVYTNHQAQQPYYGQQQPTI